MGKRVNDTVKRGPGHPMVYDRETLVPLICEDIAKGVPLEEICRREGMPSARQVHDWKRADADIAAPFAYAREVGADAIAQRLRNTARGLTPDKGGDSTGDVQRDALIVNTDLKLLAKWFPTQYGDTQSMRLLNAAGDGDARIEVVTLADQLADLINITPAVAKALPSSDGGEG